jgi:acyl carrier protein
MEALTRPEIESIVLDAVRNINLGRRSDVQVQLGADAVLFGPGGALDSLGLVALLIDVEEGLAAHGVEVLLADKAAMSQSRSPFRDVPSLVAFIALVTGPS